MYFSSNRPLEEGVGEVKDYDIWYVERLSIKSAWSAPVNMGYPINTESNEFYPSVSRLNNLYFTSDGPLSKGKDDIFVSKWRKGTYDLPVSLSDSINSDGIEFNAFIAPMSPISCTPATTARMHMEAVIFISAILMAMAFGQKRLIWALT